MTEPPAAPPPDPTADPPPFSTPQSPPYPSQGGGYPTYQRGSAPVEPPTSAYPPVTAVPAYAEGTPRRRTGLVVGGIVVALAVLSGIGGVGGFLLARGDGGNGGGSAPVASSPASPTPPAKPATPATPTPPTPPAGGRAHTVSYEVTGRGSAIVTYATNGAPSPDRVNLPWRKEVTVDQSSYLVVVFALHFQRGPLTCRILVDGTEVTTKTADHTVTCTHLVVA